jgi:hypothetical protein
VFLAANDHGEYSDLQKTARGNVTEDFIRKQNDVCYNLPRIKKITPVTIKHGGATCIFFKENLSNEN